MLSVESTTAKSEGFYWTTPEGRASVTIEANAVRRLKELVLEGFHALPKRGAEVGGILLGHVASYDPLAVRIEALEPVQCEYRFGPSFVLSDSDRTALEHILERHRSNGNAVVGLYRSCTGRELALEASDAEVLRAYFVEPSPVFLALQPLPSRECLAWIFPWRDSDVPAEPAPASVPFDVGPVPELVEEHQKPKPKPPIVAQEPAPEPKAEFEPQRTVLRPLRQARVRPDPVLEQPAVPEQRRVPDELLASEEPDEPERPLWPWVVALMILVVAGAFLYQFWAAAPVRPLGPLSLDVKRTPEGVQMKWNGPGLKNARRGVLSITDGGVEEDIQIDAAGIAGGSYSYKASSDNVLIRLTVHGEDQAPVTESFRLVAEKESPTPANASPAEAARIEEPVSVPAATPPPKVEPEPPPAEAALKTEFAAPAVPAVAVHEIQPVIPEGIRNRIRTRIVLPVIVDINASGRVTRAVASKGSDGLTTYLGERATQAAQWWRFRPAQSKSGRAVPSTKTLYFLFDSKK